MKWFALADCNNFYVSCERIFNLSLQNVPVVVLSNNDGCIISRSQEAKDLGIKMGVPVFEIKHLIKQHNIQVYSSNYALYGDISARVMNSLRELAPEVEVYSIDESFLDLSIIPAPELEPLCVTIKKKVAKWTKIPICIGVAQTKTLAKLANKLAKKDKSGNGVFILTEENRPEILSKFDIEDIWGIGRQHAKMLKKLGINNALQLSQMSDDLVKRQMSVTGLRLVKELRGEACIPILQERSMSKGICCSRSFGRALTTFSSLSEAVATFAHRCSEKLRRQNSCANIITVFIRTSPFNKSKIQYSNSRTITFSVPSNSSQEIIKYAITALKMIYKDGIEYKKAGVIVTNIIPDTQQQIGIFDNEDRVKHTVVSSLIDKLNSKYGKGTINFAIQGTGNNWRPNTNNLSPKYTTRWDEIPKIE